MAQRLVQLAQLQGAQVSTETEPDAAGLTREEFIARVPLCIPSGWMPGMSRQWL